jgi:N-acetylmuramoyl-L-alanine amidase
MSLPGRRTAGAAAGGLRQRKGIIDRDGYQLDTRHPAQAAYPRIKVLVIHYTADDFDVSLATLTDKEVSSHYLIPEKPPLHGANRGSGSWCRKRIWPGMRGQLLARQHAH